jgi:hypothetical protein
MADARALESRVKNCLDELRDAGRLAEAALLGSAANVARGRVTEASDVLERLLKQAPPGQVGWMIPIDPALRELREHPSMEPVVALLSARAS